MVARNELLKVGLAAIEGDHLLVVRKKGGHAFILPGGKPEEAEQDLETLSREVDEELGCSITQMQFEGAFVDVAADMTDTIVTVRLYTGNLLGDPRPESEIEELAWISLVGPCDLPLAPSLTNQILPHLHRKQSAAAEIALTRCRITTERLGC
jgi:8-oxo-dGTP diphosphatase